jgi:hypothetical protein
MDAEQLADALAERIGPVLPEVVLLTVVGSEMEVRAKHNERGWVSFDLASLLWDDSAESLQRVCYVVLDQIQDFVVESTTQPWPGTLTMPMPAVTVTPTEIELSYGKALVLPSIPRSP